MARPRKSEHTRIALLEAGMHLLTENGYHGTGIKQIVDTVNVPKGSFYNFFTSKEDFVEKIIEYYGHYTENEFATISKAFEDERALTRLWQYFSGKVALRYQSNESCACLVGGLSSEIAQSSAICRNAIIKLKANWLSTLTLLFSQAQTQGDIRDDITAHDIAASFHNCWQGSLLEYQLNTDPNMLMSRLRTFITAFLTAQGQEMVSSTAAYHEEIVHA